MTMTHKYDDIIQMEYPLKNADTRKHPRMSLENRAKIFMPFAALRGYEEAIAAKQKIVVPRMELSEESREYLDEKLKEIEAQLAAGRHPVTAIVYFEKDGNSAEGDGEYIQFTGMVAKLDRNLRILQLVERRFPLEDIFSIEIEE